MGAHLPTLDPGVTVLESDDPTALYRLVGRQLAETDGPVHWLDARNAAVPRAIREHAVGRTADRVRVARAFTAYQHYELARDLPRATSLRSSLIVAPNLAALYAVEDVPDAEAEPMFDATLEVLTELAAALAVPVLVTTDVERERVRAAADRLLEAADTRAGLRFDGPTFGTDLYRHAWGYQTTIPYWANLLGAADATDERDAPTAADPAVPGV
ncbi:hypothetical protein [Halorhabdus salina]|uniref:hypothetical protein n=1 Tax=Halorhabdus salina TaxID=2750670 RepID=UPI0015EF2B6E|nr:hypothetical protein [Halorhabdus salina]